MTLDETIEKVEKRFADEVEITRGLSHEYQIDMSRERIFRTHDELAREYAHILMFLRKLQNEENEWENLNAELNDIISKNEQFTEGLADIVQACMRHKRKEAHIDLNFESDDGEYAPVKVTILVED